MSNQLLFQTINELKKAGNKNKAPIWSKLAKMATKPSSAKRTVNINRINQITKDNDVVVFPGKVLGTGNVSHKITISSFSISNSAAQKILDAGGKIINFSEMIQKSPTGKGVIMLG